MSPVKLNKHRPVIAAIGCSGAALIYGDGATMPAISVLPALAGAATLVCSQLGRLMV